jgi:hypothetical protein
MNDDKERETPADEPLDEEALEGVTGGSAVLVAHELTHTVQQSATVGGNETITIGANRTESVNR